MKDSYGTYDGRKPEPPYESVDKPGRSTPRTDAAEREGNKAASLLGNLRIVLEHARNLERESDNFEALYLGSGGTPGSRVAYTESGMAYDTASASATEPESRTINAAGQEVTSQAEVKISDPAPAAPSEGPTPMTDTVRYAPKYAVVEMCEALERELAYANSRHEFELKADRAMTAALSASGSSDEVQKWAIDVEKQLCSVLGRPWTPSGISVNSLINDIASRSTTRTTNDDPLDVLMNTPVSASGKLP